MCLPQSFKIDGINCRSPRRYSFSAQYFKEHFFCGLGRLGQIFIFQNFLEKKIKMKYLRKFFNITLNALTTLVPHH
jgi:hypothetical protein